jgi:putative glycerol-1-phosphate prenyltransferase
MTILNHIKSKAKKGEKMLGILIDPDHFSNLEELSKSILILKNNAPDYVFVGGSLINNELFKKTVEALKKELTIPVIIFPGNNQQLSNKADGILLLSLISGRNPDYLIGQHVNSAFELKRSKIEILPTGYVLVNCGQPTSAQYMSNTNPIPYTKNGIAAATVLAGEQLGLSLFYLDGGSGAESTISSAMIQAVRKTISSPIIVGGGIKNKAELESAWNSGADLVIVGSAFEKNASIISELR